MQQRLQQKNGDRSMSDRAVAIPFMERQKVLLSALICLHIVLLAWSAAWQSPTLNEPSFLAAGVYSWKTGRFDLFQVNPPLVRLIATLPVVCCSPEADWTSYDPDPRSRCELNVGRDFFHANAPRAQSLLVLARWTCIPFSVLGCVVAYLWARDLYGGNAGLAAATMWCLDPNIVGHGQLMTTDVPLAALLLLFGYVYWHWLQQRTWKLAISAGFSLGLAAVTKFSALPLFGCALILLVATEVARGVKKGSTTRSVKSASVQMAAIIGLALYVINAMYGFDGSFQRLNAYEFHSLQLSGTKSQFEPGNRFKTTGSLGFIGTWPMPLPRQYVQGIDTQQRDLEKFPYPSYLRGEWKQTGWWYYYCYAAFVKTPIGTLCLLGLALCLRLSRSGSAVQLLGEATLLFPALVLFALVSSQTSFNHHFRYVLPCYGPVFIVSASLFGSVVPAMSLFRLLRNLCLLFAACSSLSSIPWTLSYFNELAGGSRLGHEHLLHSSLDWGQGLIALKQWKSTHPEARPLYLAYYGACDPADLGIDDPAPPDGPSWGRQSPGTSFQSGWYAISTNFIYGATWMHTKTDRYPWFRDRSPDAVCGASICIFRVSEDDAAQLTAFGANTTATR